MNLIKLLIVPVLTILCIDRSSTTKLRQVVRDGWRTRVLLTFAYEKNQQNYQDYSAEHSKHYSKYK